MNSRHLTITSGTYKRPALSLRDHDDDGVHTYRIPGIATSIKGTLLSVYDVRREKSRDLQGNIDIGMSRSIDGGRTWEEMQIILDMKTTGGLPKELNGCSDACILVDDTTNEIYVAAAWMHGNFKEQTGMDQWIHQWNTYCPGPGFEPDKTTQFIMTKSTDDGISWSEPVNLTRELKKEKWLLFCPAPGRGITIANGTLVMPVQGRDKNNIPFSTIMSSKDHGNNWTVGNRAIETEKGTTESAVVQLSDRSLMLNMRDNRNENGGRHGRSIAVTKDLGLTWTSHPTSGKRILRPPAAWPVYIVISIRKIKG